MIGDRRMRVCLSAGATLGVVVVLVLLLVGGRAGNAPSGPPPLSTASAQGFASRSPAPKPTSSAGSGCITSWSLAPAGRGGDGAQHMALTLSLASDVADVPTLVAVLGTPDCGASIRAATVAARQAAGLPDTDETHLVVTYRTPSGSRLLIP